MDFPATAAVGGTQIPEDMNDDESDSSEIEEGEIIEKDPPPTPIVAKPESMHADPARRFRKEPPLHRLPIPPQRDLPYAVDPNFEQSQRQYNNTHTPPYYSTPPR